MTKKELFEGTVTDGPIVDMTWEEFDAIEARRGEKEMVRHIFMEYRRPVDQRSVDADAAIKEAIARLGVEEERKPETARELLYRVAREKGVAVSKRSRLASHGRR